MKSLWSICKYLFYPAILILNGMGLWIIIDNSRIISHTNIILTQWNHSLPYKDHELEKSKQQVKEKSIIYNNKINKTHLLDGMLINRSIHGEILDVCDSLLFSSLRYVGLKKLGIDKEAKKSWDAIVNSQTDGKWHRHPRCLNDLSRDMILGLMTAMSQKPDEYEKHLSKFLTYVNQNGGYFGDGRFDRSFLTPGLGESIRNLLNIHQFHYQPMPFAIKYGFSTAEFSSLLPRRGYQLHLIALHLWIEMELTHGQNTILTQRWQTRTPISLIADMTSHFTIENIKTQRLAWISRQLVNTDPDNLFFRWLRLRSADLLTPSARIHLMQDLLSMPQFPDDDLPKDCDRKADYLWQRDSVEYSGHDQCGRIYNGGDFIWMAALLYDP